MKRVFALLLAFLMLLSVVACAQTDDPSKSTTPSGTSNPSGASDTNAPDTEPAETESPFDPGYLDDLPKDLNYNGADFLFCGVGKDFRSAITEQDQVVDRYDNAVYERTLAIQERLGVKIEEKAYTGWTDALRAGDDSYKLVHCRGKYLFANAAEGLAYLWTDLDTMDFSKDYWFMEDMTDNLTIGNKMVTAVGAYNVSSYYYTKAMVFNKALIEDLSLESPYMLVRDGSWTWEKFSELAKKAAFDLDGDGLVGFSDSLGYLASVVYASEPFLATAQKTLLTKDENDLPLYNLDTDEEFIDLFTKVFELLYDQEFWRKSTEGLHTEAGLAIFASNRALFAECEFGTIARLRDMEADFGVLPFPKYDASEETYYSWNGEIFLPMIPSPLSLEDARMTGAVLEAMSSYAIRYTIPEYYEVMLKTKYARDEESGDMFDIIMAHRIFDPGLMWVDTCEHVIRDLFMNNRRTRIVSELTRNAGSIDEALDALIYSFEDNVRSVFE